MARLLRALLLVQLWIASSASAARPVLALQPLGTTIRPEAIAAVEQALRAFYDVELLTLPPVPMPKRAWTEPRRRWRAEILLDELEARRPPRAERILGVTADDISTSKGDIKDWGVLGLARLDGRVCVISSFRVGRGVRAEAARVRLAKVAVHEIGHTLGLEHCPTVGCLMEDAQGKVTTCDREVDLCARCRGHLERTGRPAKTGIGAPWSVTTLPASPSGGRSGRLGGR